MAHASSRSRPAGAGPSRFPNHNATRFRLKFDFVRELSFLQEHLGQPYAARISDPYPARASGLSVVLGV